MQHHKSVFLSNPVIMCESKKIHIPSYPKMSPNPKMQRELKKIYIIIKNNNISVALIYMNNFAHQHDLLLRVFLNICKDNLAK